MKKILSLFVLLFTLILIYFLFSKTTASFTPKIANNGCCETICVYDKDGHAIPECEIAIVGTHLSCTTGANGCCTICDLTQGDTYYYTLSCCPDIVGLPPSFTCDGETTEYHCITYQKKNK